MNESYARQSLSDICSKLYDRKLTVSAGGNMSVRLNDDEILITPSGRNKGALVPDDMVKLTMSGEVIGTGRPSIEHRFHLALYSRNKDTNAIVHCHPLYCTTLAVKNAKIRCDLTPEGILLLGDVQTIDYFTPGSQELVDAIAEHSSSAVMLMRRHGALTQGKNLEEAFDRMEELEFQAHLQIMVGRAKGLPRSEIEKIRGM